MSRGYGQITITAMRQTCCADAIHIAKLFYMT